MLTSLTDPQVQAVIDAPTRERLISFDGGQPIEVAPPYPSPTDWRDHWIYMLMIDRFNNPDRSPMNLPFDHSFAGFQGGTFKGVEQQLGYLKELGVGAIWLTPVLKNYQYEDTYHGYAVQNYLAVDPHFATDPGNAEAELRHLIDAAHAHGIYVVYDISIAFTGNVFDYRSTAGNPPYPIAWRDADGRPNPDWTCGSAIDNPPLDATIFPEQLRRNSFFHRHDHAYNDDQDDIGTLKHLLHDNMDLLDHLISISQFFVAKYDVDAFRIDALKHLGQEPARIFANAVREYALASGKTNFFIFGEVWTPDQEDYISSFIGRNPGDVGGPMGVDAAADFLLYHTLFDSHFKGSSPCVIKGTEAPIDLVRMFDTRKADEDKRLTSHAEASRYFVTFIDNHDLVPRFYFPQSQDPNAQHQLFMALACLFSFQGIPCVYYGTEQGLRSCVETYTMSSKDWKSELVREALWGKEHAFNTEHPFYKALREIAKVRSERPALRYGRQYFRQLSTDGKTFDFCRTAPGVFAFSRILSYHEVVVVVNTNTEAGWTGSVLVDYDLNPVGTHYRVRYSNKAGWVDPDAVKPVPQATISDSSGNSTIAPTKALPVSLRAAEVQIIVWEHAAESDRGPTLLH